MWGNDKKFSSFIYFIVFVSGAVTQICHFFKLFPAACIFPGECILVLSLVSLAFLNSRELMSEWIRTTAETCLNPEFSPSWVFSAFKYPHLLIFKELLFINFTLTEIPYPQWRFSKELHSLVSTFSFPTLSH